ncbi:MAG: DNA mismatch repair endonuclease MutL [Lachnoclostridium sp.]|nr:DNA mismatch repair endonuclease MutL [Lachnospira sp.]MCM1247885.1 DNA mismatch repair endonuclease MutL [Lachnoclostridium sp.]MCM1534539.1 DNA mismatch repair endonuclease MutL [Clostridium sp.]
MAQIHVLDSETIDKIAAGEVVERPASVVKELVENAIDAGADAITVEARDGGIEFVRVTDNGSGMEKEQLRTAFLRHATSKIEQAQDLLKVASLGFRGEALSSIAAVSKTEVITKTKESLIGTRIVYEGGVEKSFEEIGAPDGTTFIMRNLFFNTPVRRKFLKQPATEGGYIIDLMEHLALSRPDISFKFLLGNQTRFHTSGNGDLREVIYRIYGREVASSLVPIQEEKNGVRVEGYLGKPAIVRSNRNFELYYVNGRFIKSNIVAKALEEGYKEYLMQHKFPLCVLHISMDRGDVDVNVHPTKMDVRFSDGIGFCGSLSEMVRNTLKNHEMIPGDILTDEKEKKEAADRERKAAEKEKVPEPFEQVRRNTAKVMEETTYQADAPKMQDFLQKPVWNHVFEEKKIENTDNLTENPAKNAGNGEDDFFVEAKAQMQADMEDLDVVYGELQPPEQTSRMEESEENRTKKPASTQENATQMNLFEEKLLTIENRSRYQIIGQVFDTYWLVQFEDKLFIIDQHAAHEKVKYERLIKQFHEKNVASQALLPPIIVSLTGQEEAMLKQYLEVFESLGFEVESFGGNEYALRSVPVDLYGCSERELFLNVLDELSEGIGKGSFRVIEEKIASMSCKAAVKGNNSLSRAEAETLIDELLTLENPYNCPHGRPTIISMTETELEKKFKRIV